jgi:L-threonylcarbamoyladenylate synthase
MRNQINQDNLALAAGYLRSGKIVLLPSDTIYGLSVRADSAKAINSLRRFKGREGKKPFLILVSSLAMAKKYLMISPSQSEYLKRIWGPRQRPTTVILKDKKLLPRSLNIKEDSLAVRLPKNEFLVKIIRSLGQPLVSTSANLSGLEPLQDVKDIEKSLGQKRPHLIIAGKNKPGRRPSRLIDLRCYPEIKIIRK